MCFHHCSSIAILNSPIGPCPTSWFRFKVHPSAAQQNCEARPSRCVHFRHHGTLHICHAESGCFLGWLRGKFPICHALNCSGTVVAQSFSCNYMCKKIFLRAFLVGSEEAPRRILSRQVQAQTWGKNRWPPGGVWLGATWLPASAHALWFDMPIQGNFFVLKSQKQKEQLVNIYKYAKWSKCVCFLQSLYIKYH